MATERERFREDAENNGYAVKAIDDTATEDRAQRSYRVQTIPDRDPPAPHR